MVAVAATAAGAGWIDSGSAEEKYGGWNWWRRQQLEMGYVYIYPGAAKTLR
jgi:hypothetical protein